MACRTAWLAFGSGPRSARALMMASRRSCVLASSRMLSCAMSDTVMQRHAQVKQRGSPPCRRTARPVGRRSGVDGRETTGSEGWASERTWLAPASGAAAPTPKCPATSVGGRSGMRVRRPSGRPSPAPRLTRPLRCRPLWRRSSTSAGRWQCVRSPPAEPQRPRVWLSMVAMRLPLSFPIPPTTTPLPGGAGSGR